MSLLLLFKTTVAPGAGGSSGHPASLPHLGLQLAKRYTVTAEQGSYSVDGRDANFPRAYIIASEYTTYTISGQDATLRTIGALTAEQGSYSLSGQAANLLYGYLLTAAGGTYELVGYPATLEYSDQGNIDSPAPLPSLGLLGGLGYTAPVLTAEQGSYSITGQDISSVHIYRLDAAAGSYNYEGQIAGLTKQGASSENPAPLPHIGLILGRSSTLTLTADPGIYSILGSDGLVDLEFTGESGSYAISGQVATLAYGYNLVAGNATYAITGQDAAFVVTGNITMAAEQGSYSVAGQVANLLRGYPITAAHGFFSLLGQQATLSTGTSGTVGTVNYTNINDSLSASGRPTLTGSVNYTNGQDTLVATGENDNTINGVVNYTNVNDTLASSGQSTASGTLEETNANDTLSGVGTTTVVGTLAKTNQNDTSSGYGYPGDPATITTKLLLTGAGQT